MRTWKAILASVLMAFCSAHAQLPWHDSLYISGGGRWEARLPIRLSNHSTADAKGQPVSLTLGTDSPLIGLKAGSLRIVDDEGEQLKFAVVDALNRPLLEEAITPGSRLFLPVTLKRGGTETYHVYFGNPQAWCSPDILPVPLPVSVNGGFETLKDGFPLDWFTATTDGSHQVSLSTETPASGTYCIKTSITPGTAPTWFKVGHRPFPVVPGTKGILRVKVKGKNTQGKAGWFLHIGLPNTQFVVNRGATVPQDSFDWTELSIPFTVPPNTSEIRTGSAFYGTQGTAWYDDFSIEFTHLPKTGDISVTPLAPEHNSFREIGRLPLSVWNANYAYRFPISVTNKAETRRRDTLVSVDLSSLRNTLSADARLECKGRQFQMFTVGSTLFFKADLAPQATTIYYLYTNPPKRQQAQSGSFGHALASDILSDQVMIETATLSHWKDFKDMLLSTQNLIRNPSFEETDANRLPLHWDGSAERKKTLNTIYTTGTHAPLGQRCASLTAPPTDPTDWIGWKQTVTVTPRQHYVYGAFVSAEQVTAPIAVHLHLLDAQRRVVPDGYQATQSTGESSFGWRPLVGFTTAIPGTDSMELHLTMNGTGTLKHDAAFLAPVDCGTVENLETQPVPPEQIVFWQVDPIIKVFQEDIYLPSSQDTSVPYGHAIARLKKPTDLKSPFGIELAQNEAEPLQIAVRAGTDLRDMTVQCLEDSRDGISLDIGMVGYVPIDAKSAYSSSQKESWYQLIPRNSNHSDGWPGLWPDPIRPVSTTRLKANQTQPVWLTVTTSATAKPGIHNRTLRITCDRHTVTIPVSIRVWNFKLPENTDFPAVYDLRIGQQWHQPAKSNRQVLDEILQLMRERKVCPDRIQATPLFTRNQDGTVTADFTEYDKAAEDYFNHYRFPVSYTPNLFYLFGWAYPPKNILGQKPYPGKSPYHGQDRLKLNPDYVKTYQTCLRLYMDHMRQKGWDKKVVLYLSDEPHFKHDHVVRQMKAICAMIKAVEPKLPIYVSTWQHCRDWDGYISLWGAGHYGCFPEQEIRQRQKAGDRFWFTTDGQMCTDTPYAGIERMLPHYCFKYNVEAYEFWGLTWLTFDPWKIGWHRYHKQANSPTDTPRWTRYPNGDGFLIYPGHQFPGGKPVPSIRLEAARDGVEDHQYLTALAKHRSPEAKKLLKKAQSLVSMPAVGGRYTTKFIPHPEAIRSIRFHIGQFLNRNH